MVLLVMPSRKSERLTASIYDIDCERIYSYDTYRETKIYRFWTI